MSILQEISISVYEGRTKKTLALIEQAISQGIAAQSILDHGIIDGMCRLGNDLSNNKVSIASMLIANRTMKLAIESMNDYFPKTNEKNKFTIILGMAQGDTHENGKNIISAVLSSKGIEVIDLGTDASPQKFIDAATAHSAKVICCSAVLAESITNAKLLVQAFENTAIRKDVSIILGGYGMNERFVKSIGADYYAGDVISCIELVMQLSKEYGKKKKKQPV